MTESPLTMDVVLLQLADGCEEFAQFASISEAGWAGRALSAGQPLYVATADITSKSKYIVALAGDLVAEVRTKQQMFIARKRSFERRPDIKNPTHLTMPLASFQRVMWSGESKNDTELKAWVTFWGIAKVRKRLAELLFY